MSSLNRENRVRAGFVERDDAWPNRLGGRRKFSFSRTLPRAIYSTICST